jgi:capsular polysaccharide biosynthesis protein
VESQGYLEIFRQRWLVIAAAVALGLGAAAAIAFAIPSTYTATATMFLSVQDPSASLGERSQFAQDRVASYPDLVHSEDVLRPTIDQLDLGVSVQELSTMVSAKNADNTVLINVSAKADDAETAAAIANAVAENLSDVVADIENGNDFSVLLDQRIAATAPTSPSAPQRTVIIGLGLIAGLALGAVSALLLTRFDRRLRSVAEVRRASGLPVLGLIPRRLLPRRHDSVEPLVAAAMADAMLTIRQANGGNMPGLLMLVPAGKKAAPGRIRLGLAGAAASTGQDVILVETDHANDVAELATLNQRPGLAEVLEGTATLPDSVVTLDSPAIRVLPAGTSATTVAQAEASLRSTASTLFSESDLVIAQSTQSNRPVGLPLLAPYADVVVVLVRHGRSTDTDLARAVSQLRIVSVRPIGVVLYDVPRGRRIDLTATWQHKDFASKPGKAVIPIRRRPARAKVQDVESTGSARAAGADQLDLPESEPALGTDPGSTPKNAEEQVVPG